MNASADVTPMFVIGAVFIAAVLLLVVSLATSVYFFVRLKLLASRVENLEHELKLVADRRK